MSDGSVFPEKLIGGNHSNDGWIPCDGGLTKRELFAAMAAMAMMGMLDSPTDVDEWTVSRAVSMADTLIAELKKDKK